MEFVATELRSCDRLGIVCYSSEATVQLPMRTMDDAGKAAALAAIRQIQSGGSTNFSGGVLAALAELQSSRDEQRSICPAAVIVLTDGHPTAGISNPTQLKHSLGSAHAELGFSAPMFTFGFGEDHNSMLLTELAEGAEGMYSHVEDAEMIASSFAECLGGITSLVAQAVQLKITPGDGVSIDRVFSPHKQKGGEEGAAAERPRTIVGWPAVPWQVHPLPLRLLRKPEREAAAQATLPGPSTAPRITLTPTAACGAGWSSASST